MAKHAPLLFPAIGRSGETTIFNAGEKVVPLQRNLFKDGLIILNNQVESATLSSKKTKHQIKMGLSGFPYFCLWTKEKEALDFLCLEPFYGLPDVVDQKQELSRKTGNSHTAPNEEEILSGRLTVK